jgi:hypothetical protein
MMDNLKLYLVEYEPFVFIVAYETYWAEDITHAREQFANAHPDGVNDVISIFECTKVWGEEDDNAS